MNKYLSFILLLALMLSLAGQSFAVVELVGHNQLSGFSLPVKATSSYGYTQQIYDRGWINRSGEITKIRFRFQCGNFHDNIQDWTIYLGHTTKTSFLGVEDWIAHSSLTQVFSGDVSSLFSVSEDWLVIDFDTPFYYNNVDNLVIAVLESSPSFNAAGVSWGTFDNSGYTSLGYFSDSSCPNLNSLPLAQYRLRACNFIGLTFRYIPLPPRLESPSNGALLANSVTLTWSPADGSPPPTGYDVYIDSHRVSYNQSGTSYTATDLGLGYHSWNVRARNNDGISDLSANGFFYVIDGKIVGSGTDSQAFPFNSLWGYGRSLGLYKWSEVGGYGYITDLGWSVEVPSNAAIPYKIYIKDGAGSSMNSMTWEQFKLGATLVKEGIHTFNRNDWHIIELDTAFHFISGELLIGVETNYGGSGSGTGISDYPKFHYTSTTTDMHQYWQRDDYEPSSSGSLNTQRPNLYLVKVNHGNPFPYTEGFESGQAHQSSVKGWVQRGSYRRFWEANTSTAHYMAPRSGIYNAILKYEGDKWLMKPFCLTSGQWYEVSLWAMQDGDEPNNASVGIFWGDSPKISSMTNTVKAQTGVAGCYQELKGRFSAQSSGVHWIGIRGMTNWTPYCLSLDDIKIEQTYPTIGDIGTGISSNDQYTYPAVYGGYYRNAREQYIVTASELTSEGFQAGYIDHLAFMVQNTNDCGALPNFTISMRTTSSTSFTDNSFYTGLTEAYYRPSYTPTVGINNHFLHTPFYWDGASSLVIQVSFDMQSSYSYNASTAYTNTEPAYRAMYYRSDYTSWDDMIAVGTRDHSRPNIRFRIACPIEGLPLPPDIYLASPANGSVQPQDGFKLTWRPQLFSGGLADSYTVYLSTDPDNLFGQHSWVATNGCFNPITQGGMNFARGVRYYWTVIATNSYGTSWPSPWYFDIEPYPAVTSYPYAENFDSTAAGEMPEGWTIIASHSGADYRGWTTDAAIGGSSEPHVTCVRRHMIYPKDEWMITPPFLMQAGESYTISFKVKGLGWGGVGEALALRWGTAPTVASMTSNPPLYDDTQIRFGYWTEISEEFIPPSSGVYYFGWYAYSPANLRYIAVDDITIDLSPGLVPPVVSVSISGSNVVLSWDPVPGANFYYIYASEDPYNFGSTPIAGTDNNQFVVPANLAKRFFRVTSGDVPCKSFGVVDLPGKSSAGIGNTDEWEDIKEKSSNIKRL